MNESGSGEPPDPETASNVLCVQPAIGQTKSDTCRQFLRGQGLPGTVVGVTVASSPAQRMAEWTDALAPQRTNFSFIDVVHGGRSAATPSPDGFGGQGAALVELTRLETVDLQRLGEEITAAVEDATQEPVVVCLDSLTDLLQFESAETVERFLDALTDRIAGSDATAHYHIDAQGHPERTFKRLAPLFDETVGFDDVGTS